MSSAVSAWGNDDGTAIMNGDVTLADLHERQLADDSEPKTQSGHQEFLENIVARTIERAR